MSHTHSDVILMVDLAVLAKAVHRGNVARGFYDDTPDRRDADACLARLALIVSEVAEVMEAVREPGPSKKIGGYTQEEEEVADVLIRLLDYVEWRRLNLRAVLSKMDYNDTRGRMHGGKRA